VSTTLASDDGLSVAGDRAGRKSDLVRPRRPQNRHLLEPVYGRHFNSLRVWAFLRGLHPVTAVAVSLVACVVLIAAVLIGSGLVVAHFVVHDRVGHWDEHLNGWFARHRSPIWNRVTGDFTAFANTLAVAAVAAVVTVVLLMRRWGRFAMLLVAGLTAELAAFLSTDYVVDRPRPTVPHLGSTPSTSSWPSGHVAATAVLYGGIAVLVMVATSRRLPRLTAWMAAIALTTCVALSRIYRGDHHLTDTIAGLVLGAAALGTAILAIRVWSGQVTDPAVPGLSDTRRPARSGSVRRRP
jgi:membrane-associated phospholipid phosphatase